MASACHCVLGFHSTAVNKAVYSVVYFNTIHPTQYNVVLTVWCTIWTWVCCPNLPTAALQFSDNSELQNRL